ncbi:hypothetical protein FJZ28_00180 [Candidatus Peregrinibacteria bacterium]|nr:hypothetical protein [Candidatus Peregrinibacteria bacterium]
MTIRPFFINGILVVGSVVLFIAGVECTLRITGLQTVQPNPPQIYQTSEDPRISYELKPNLDREPAYKAHVSTDAHGFRLNAAQQSRTNNQQPVIVLLGDSVTFGYGVDNDETLAAQLEQLQPDHSVINAAVPGYSLTMEVAAYETKIAEMNPDAVVIVFFWNDLDGFLPGKLDEMGILRSHDWQPGQDDCMPITEGILSIIPRQCWLNSHSALYKAMKKIINLRQSKTKQKVDRTPVVAEQETVNAKHLEEYGRILRSFSRILPERRFFVIWPDNNMHTATRPSLREAAEANGFTVIDLYDLFGNTVETLPWDTVHPSPESIRKSAEYIAPFLNKP